MGPPLSRSEARGWLAAIIDGEGSVYYKPPPYPKRTVTVINSDEDILAMTCELLDRLGIRWQRYAKSDWRMKGSLGKKPSFEIQVTNREGIEVLAKLPLQCSYKREALRAAAASYRKRRPSPDALAEMYAKAGTIRKLAAKLGVSFGTAQNWLHDANVPINKERLPRIPVERERLQELYEARPSLSAVARELGHPRSTVAHWMRRYGIERKGAGRPRGVPWSDDERRKRGKERT